MEISFKTEGDKRRFADFVCKNKAIIKDFLAFGKYMKNPIVRAIFSALSSVVDIVCD